MAARRKTITQDDLKNFMTTTHTSTQPIGIFDSGIGGLTVVHALVQALPKEDLIYFGDTAHMPYGDKPTATIQSYAVKIAHMLLQQECKLILIACNSASAAAYELVKEYVNGKAIVMNVIDPTIHFLQSTHAHQSVGLIGTRQTVNSHVYKRKIDELNCGIHLYSYPTNLLASAIEEFGNHPVIDAILNEYLSQQELSTIDALVLACTHYPVIKESIAKQYKKFHHKSIDIIDSSNIVAKAVKQQLEDSELLNQHGIGKKQFYVSAYTETFAANAKIFFGDQLSLDYYPLWD